MAINLTTATNGGYGFSIGTGEYIDFKNSSTVVINGVSYPVTTRVTVLGHSNTYSATANTLQWSSTAKAFYSSVGAKNEVEMSFFVDTNGDGILEPVALTDTLGIEDIDRFESIIVDGDSGFNNYQLQTTTDLGVSNLTMGEFTYNSTVNSSGPTDTGGAVNLYFSNQSSVNFIFDSSNAGAGIYFRSITLNGPLVALPQTPCFVRGTLIKTDRGDVRVQNLSVGDMVLTLHHGLQPIRWIGCVEVNLKRSPNHRPIKFKPGSILGNQKSLSISPNHCVVIDSPLTEILSGKSESLIPAKYLVNDNDVIIDESIDSVEYFHIMFDRHQIIFSNDVPTESFLLGDQAWSSVGDASRAELLEFFPHLADSKIDFPSAIPILNQHHCVVIKYFLQNQA